MLVTGRAAQVLEALEAGRAHCDADALDRLWQSVPPDMRLPTFTPSAVPPRYAGAFSGNGWPAGIDFSGLPEPMARELAWCVWRFIELGGKVAVRQLRMLARRLGELTADLAIRARSSLLEASADTWLKEIGLAVHRRTGRLPGAATMKDMRWILLRCMRLLASACDLRPWWQREIWDPVEDPRIPVREHEPHRGHSINFRRISTPWLRRGMQWYGKISLETGTLTWTTIERRVDAAVVFEAFLADHDIAGPHLCDDPLMVRQLMVGYLGYLRAHRVQSGPTAGAQASASLIRHRAAAIAEFYTFMSDNARDAAAVLGEPGWLALGPQHARLYRHGELPRAKQADTDGEVIDDACMTQIMAGVGILADPAGQGGFGNPQAMRILLLTIRLGRRINEICMLGPDPLLPLNTPPAAGGDPAGLVARLRYQQTKIDGAPDTIPVDCEIVVIIGEQQAWAKAWFAEHGAPGKTPKYLFLAEKMNRNGDLPYPLGTLHKHLTDLAVRLDIRDRAGHLVDFNRTHRFRHTVGTSMLNAGVPIHVVQRYLGHLSPAMTMHYAKTLAEIAEAEFLRYRKVTADARSLAIGARDLYDMLQLDKRTDRILPNGWCLLPPRQSCDRGNACLTCDKFATDATFLPELRAQKDRTVALIDSRQAAFTQRAGAPMSPGNVWLDGRRREAAALDAIITTLEAMPGDARGEAGAVRGAGIAARTDAAVTRLDREHGR